MKSLLEFITDRENIPKREDMPKEDIPKEDMTKEDMPKEDKDIHKENMPKIDKDTPKEDIPKMDKDTHKEDNIINNENKVDDFRRAVSSIGFKRIKVYRF